MLRVEFLRVTDIKMRSIHVTALRQIPFKRNSSRSKLFADNSKYRMKTLIHAEDTDDLLLKLRKIVENSQNVVIIDDNNYIIILRKS